MRKTNIKGNNISAGRLPQRLLPEGANPWEDSKFVEAYDQVAQVVNEMPRNPQIGKAMKLRQVAGPIAAVLQAVREHPPSDKALRLLENYERSIAEQTKKYLETNLRFSSGQQETNFSDIAERLSPNLLLGIPTPGQISTVSAAWSSFYRDLLGLIEQVSQNPQDQNLLVQLAASALVLTEGVHRDGDRQSPSPFSKVYVHPTTDPTSSPSFLPSAETLAQTAALVERYGAAAVGRAMKQAREETVEQIKELTIALSNMLRRDPQNPQKLDNIASSIIGHLASIQQQYNIEVPGIDTQSSLTTETRAKAMRPIEELVRALSSIKEIEQYRERKTSGVSQYAIIPPELGQTSGRVAEFHSRQSMYAVGGTKPPASYEQHSLQEAEQKAPRLQKEFFEEQMNQYYIGVMKMIATIAGIAARKLADINLRNKLNNLTTSGVPNQNQAQTTRIDIPIATGYGSISVKVTRHEVAGNEGEAPQTARGYIPIGLPLGNMRAQPQLPSTFEEGQVRPAATITVSGKTLKIGTEAATNRRNPSIEAVNPQQAVKQAVLVSNQENQRLLIPTIEVVSTGNNNLRVVAKLQEILAPTINNQQIQTIRDGIVSIVDLMINTYRQQGGRIPENLLHNFEMAKALQNNPSAQFHSALLRIEEEALENGTIIRKPVLNITFYLPENELRIIQEAARIKEQSNRLRSAGISTEESDTETEEEARERQTPNTTRRQPRPQSIGTYKRAQVLQPTFQEAQPGSTNRQTAADRLVVVSFELRPGTYEGLPADNLHPIEQVIFDIYNQFKEQIETGAFIASDQDSTEFVKDVAADELKDAIKQATQYLDFQVARKIATTMLSKQIAERYTQRINVEYAAFLPQARQFPEEFDRITQQSALPTFQEGPITFMARPIVQDNRLELLVLGYARTTPYLLKIQGTNNQAGLVSDITNAYMGISEQSFEGRKQYSGGIFYKYNLILEDLDGQLEAKLSETPTEKGFAPDATLASGAVGLPSGIVTIVGTASTETGQMNAEVAQPVETAGTANAQVSKTVVQPEGDRSNQPEMPAPAMQDDDGSTEPNRKAAGEDIGTMSFFVDELFGENITAPNDSGEARDATAASAKPGTTEAPAGEPTPQPAAEPQVRKPFEYPNINIIRIENIELPLTEADENEPTARIFIIAEGGTSNNQGGDSLKPTGTGTIVIGIIKDEQSGKKKVKVYRINHQLGDKSTLTNNRAEAFALLTGATLAREMIETLMENGIIQNKEEAEIWMMSDSQLMVGQMSGWARINDPFLGELVKRTVGTIKDRAGTIRIAHHSKSNGNPLGRLIHEVDHLSRIPRGDRGGGSYRPLDIATELEQALNDFKAKTEAENYQALGRGAVSNIRNIETIEAIQKNEPLTIVRITDLIPQSENNTPGQVFDLDISDFVNDFKQSLGSTNQGPASAAPTPAAQPAAIEPASAPEAPAPAPATPEPEPAPAAPAPAPAEPQPAPNQDIRVLNKFVGSIKKVGEEEWLEIYRKFKAKARITPKEISHGRNERRGISKQLLMLIGGAQRAEHRLDQIVTELRNRPVFASEVISAQIPDFTGETPDTERLYKTAPVGQLQARPQATQSAIDPNQPFVSFHGRRDAANDEMIESFQTGRKIAQAGGVLLVGGAVGADFAAALGALSEGGKVIIIHFSDFKTDEYGYPEFTRQALTNIYNNQNQLFQEDNFMQFVVREIFNHPRNRLRETEIFTKLVNRLATLMTLIAVAPNHPIIQEVLRQINTQLPPTAAVAFYTLRVISDQPRRTAAESATIRDKLMVAISDLTIEGPNRGPGSGTAKAIEFALTIAEQAPDEKDIMTIDEILDRDVETIRAELIRLNEARKRKLEAYKQQQQQS